MRATTRENLGKPMAIVLYEKGKGEALSVATIQGEFGNDFQITGNFTPQETADLALLTRAGALAAPMEIIEERTIGPSLGADNISKGFSSVMVGFAAITLFMCAYYLLFGMISSVALAAMPGKVSVACSIDSTATSSSRLQASASVETTPKKR